MSETTHVLDLYYLSITFLMSLALQGLLFGISFTFQTDKLTDVGGATNFFLIAIFTLFAGAPLSWYARNIIVSVLVMVWAVRLGGFLLFRVLKTGKDGRFDEMRAHFFRFMGFWLFQLFWVWTVSLPVTIVNSPRVTEPVSGGAVVRFGSSTDIAGIVMFAIGFAIEVIGDTQKYRFKSRKPPKSAICNVGIWKYTRHPNFFGEIFLWWGIWTLCIEPARARRSGGARAVEAGGRAALWASVLGPIFITLLLIFVSGLPPAEKPTAKRYYLQTHGSKRSESGDPWADYKSYLNRTSILIPMPPSFYARLPRIVKKTILLDLPMFEFSESKDGPKALEEERKKNQESA